MNAPVVGLTVTVPPPVEVPDTGALKDSVRPAGSVNTARPATTPVTPLGDPAVGVFATGVPASTATVTS